MRKPGSLDIKGIDTLDLPRARRLKIKAQEIREQKRLARKKVVKPKPKKKGGSGPKTIGKL